MVGDDGDDGSATGRPGRGLRDSGASPERPGGRRRDTAAGHARRDVGGDEGAREGVSCY